MRQSVLTRASLFGIAILAAIIYLLPTFVSPLPSWWASFLPTDRINLGLDLQGGSHLVLDVKVDKAIENNVERVGASSPMRYARRAFRASRWNESRAPSSRSKYRRRTPSGCAAY